MRTLNNITRGINRLGINAGKPAGLSKALQNKFLFLWTGGYTGDNLKDSLGSAAVITVTGKDWTTRYIPQQPDYIKVKYGLLYNWYAATDARNICSVGWHVPSRIEYQTLSTFLGGGVVSGAKLKCPGFDYWLESESVGTNESGFSARGNGARNFSSGDFQFLMSYAYLWTSTLNASRPYYVNLSYTNNIVSISNAVGVGFIKQGCAIRLIKDSTTLSDGETGTYTGNDGKVYRTICIGTQEWLADNLAETKYRNSDDIQKVTDGAIWAALKTGALCAYNNDWDNVSSPISTFSVPDNATFIGADGTDDFWFDALDALQQKTFEDLIASTTLRTFVKYADFEPYNVYGIGILKAGETLTDGDKIKLNRYFKLWAEYWGELMDSGYMKDNRIGIE